MLAAASGALPAEAEPIERWLTPTRQTDFRQPALAALIRDGARATPRETAVALHDLVRERVKFGWLGGFYDVTAQATLTRGLGWCQTKSMLFAAALRGAGIPARLHYVEIRPDVLGGLIAPPSPWLDHAYVEVFLDGRWVATDSFIADTALADAAVKRLTTEGRRRGYGSHVAGVGAWDGATSAFRQAVPDGETIGRDFGVFVDAAAFYAATPDAHNRLNPVLRFLMPPLLAQANAQAEALRQSNLARSA